METLIEKEIIIKLNSFEAENLYCIVANFVGKNEPINEFASKLAEHLRKQLQR